MPEVIIHEDASEGDFELTYSVIVARYMGKWLFVNHRRRGGFELPAGKIEYRESALEAAKRELREETGAIDYTIKAVCVYSVKDNEYHGSGMLFFAEVKTLGEIIDKSEVTSVEMFDGLPEKLTFSEIQSKLFMKVKQMKC